MAAVFTPWRTIYILPHLIDDEYLIAHEMAHASQEVRDGKLYFWTRIVWWFIRYGHKHSPYEIEADQIARGQIGCQ